MYCIRKVQDDLYWVGANDRRLAMFEGVYSVPYGVSYNSYLLLDEKTVLFDTVDKAVTGMFLENVEAALAGRSLDYLIVHHMEPDHSASLSEVVHRYPDVKIVCNAATRNMMKQFFSFDVDGRWVEAREGEISASSRLLWSIGRRLWYPTIPPMAFSSPLTPSAPSVPSTALCLPMK